MEYFFNRKIKLKGDVFAQEYFMEYKEDTFDVLSSSFLRNIDALPQQSEVKVRENDCRFDVISYKQLANTNLWWILMEYNNKIDFNIQSHELLKIPNQNGIMSLLHKLRVKENIKNLKIS